MNELVANRRYKSTPTRDQIEKISQKISDAEIKSWERNHAKDPYNYSWSMFLFNEKHERNVSSYLDLKFERR